MGMETGGQQGAMSNFDSNMMKDLSLFGTIFLGLLLSNVNRMMLLRLFPKSASPSTLARKKPKTIAFSNSLW